LNGIQEVTGSIPVSSTKKYNNLRVPLWATLEVFGYLTATLTATEFRLLLLAHSVPVAKNCQADSRVEALRRISDRTARRAGNLVFVSCLKQPQRKEPSFIQTPTRGQASSGEVISVEVERVSDRKHE
jgi:hypothetical protein